MEQRQKQASDPKERNSSCGGAVHPALVRIASLLGQSAALEARNPVSPPEENEHGEEE